MHKVRSFIYFQPSAGNDSIVLFSTFTPFLAAGLARTLAASSPMSSSPDALAPVAACNAILLRKLSFVAKSQLICHEITVLLRNHSFVTKSQFCYEITVWLHRVLRCRASSRWVPGLPWRAARLAIRLPRSLRFFASWFKQGRFLQGGFSKVHVK